MDRKKLAAKLKEKKKIVIGVVAVVAVGAGASAYFKKSKAPAEHAEAKHDAAKHEDSKHKDAEHGEAKQIHAKQEATDGEAGEAGVGGTPQPEEHSEGPHSHGFFEAFRNHWNNLWSKVGDLERSEVTNERLVLENAHLRNQLEAKTFAIQAEEARRLTDAFGRRIEAETGSPVGRLLSSITYQPPSSLLPRQLYALGVSYFQARENEKAAVIFTQLVESRTTEEFKTPRNYLLAAVSWYRLDHFEASDTYLSRALETDGAKQFEEASDQDSRSTEELSLFAQIRLWRALTAKRLGDEKGAQHWLTELMDHHPGSRVAQWINREDALRGREKGGRGVASAKTEKTEKTEKVEKAEKAEHGGHHE
jgi:tetratricopeptide (TPR) repeat protein